jgi:hypothetical protein
MIVIHQKMGKEKRIVKGLSLAREKSLHSLLRSALNKVALASRVDTIVVGVQEDEMTD